MLEGTLQTVNSKFSYLILPYRTNIKLNSTAWYSIIWYLGPTNHSMLLSYHFHETSVSLWGSLATPCLSISTILITHLLPCRMLFPPTTYIYWLAFNGLGNKYVLGALWDTCFIYYSFYFLCKINSNLQMRKLSFRDLPKWGRKRMQFRFSTVYGSW